MGSALQHGVRAHAHTVRWALPGRSLCVPPQYFRHCHYNDSEFPARGRWWPQADGLCSHGVWVHWHCSLQRVCVIGQPSIVHASVDPIEDGKPEVRLLRVFDSRAAAEPHQPPLCSLRAIVWCFLVWGRCICSLMHLSNCGFTGTIPDSYSVLTLLDYFAVGGNQLSGALPTWLGNLLSLRYHDNCLSHDRTPSLRVWCDYDWQVP